MTKFIPAKFYFAILKFGIIALVLYSKEIWYLIAFCFFILPKLQNQIPAKNANITELQN